MSKIQTFLFLLTLFAVNSAHAQSPTGIIAGIVTDPAGAAVAGARIVITNRSTAARRNLTTSEDGEYSAAALPPGDYHITAEATGFSLPERTATVEAGTTIRVNLQLQVSAVSETVSARTATPLIRYDDPQISGLVSRNQVENLPLNGRNFLELAKLEPGVQPPTRATASNRNFVPALGQPVGSNGRGTRVTVDGGSIMTVGSGGTAMGFSQEVVQEFQVATVNFELTTGITSGAAINVTTRSGGNNLHGTAFYFFRDHTIAAYPVLDRDIANPDPFFQRRQFGFALSGPIRRDRVFFFGDYERNEQRGVGATAISVPEFAHLNRITPSPYFNTQFSVRVDGRLSDAHTGFIRYSHDGIESFGPQTQSTAYPSSWRRLPGWADQSILGLTSVFNETLVNELRFSYFFVSSNVTAVTEDECPNCLGVGAPSITVAQTGLSIGGSATQRTLARRFHFTDYVTWQRATHRLRFGLDWEYNRGGTVSWNSEPANLTLFSPSRARMAGMDLPSAFRTLDDFLRLPLQSVTVGIGDPRVPQENDSFVPSWNTLRLFFQDTWRFHPQLTVNYGLGWGIDRNLNYDLSKPALLAPLLGADGLGPTRKQWKNFSPVLGLAWAPGRDGKTVIRAGAGLYYDFQFYGHLDTERALLGPPGLGRQVISGNRLQNCLEGIPGVPQGKTLNFQNPSRFTGADLLTCLPAIRADLARNLFANANPSIQAIQLSKQGTLNPVDVPRWSALHGNFGFQRELARDFVVSADFTYRHFDHLGMGQLDLNHWNRAIAKGGVSKPLVLHRYPVIPECDDAERNDPNAQCSTGAINVQTNAGRATYKGLLVRADKRFSRGFQLLGSWAYSSNTGINTPASGTGEGFNLDDWLGNRGPLANDITHIVNLAGVVQLPWRVQVGFNFSYASAPPLSAFVGGIDFNGDGTTDDLLPGTTVNAFNRGLGRAELERLVAQFNQTKAGTFDAKGTPIHKLTLPKQYWLGDNFHAFDLRLSREFVVQERWRLMLIGEAFNVYNSANLSGYSGNLNSDTPFGQPTSRATQVFGSGGPRAFQLGVRFSY
jgi:hypothetical protein